MRRGGKQGERELDQGAGVDDRVGGGGEEGGDSDKSLSVLDNVN